MTTCQIENKEQKLKIHISLGWKLYLELLKVQYCDHLLFNIFLVGLFFILSNINIASYADDNTSYIATDNIDDLVKSL